MKNYKEFIVTANPFNVDLLSGCLWNLEIAGIQEMDNYLIVNALEENNISSEIVENLLNGLIKENLIENFSIDEKTYEDQNWNAEWEKTINVIQISDKIVIKPTFKDYIPKQEQVVIEIVPKMSFGTGEHQTTKLVLLALEKYVVPGIKTIDVGSGTAVLAIASVLLGGASAIAIDNDEWCLINGNENIELNNVSDRIEVKNCEVHEIEESDFNLVLANINKNVLLNINEELYKKITPGGKLILSGILDVDKDDIKKSYSLPNLNVIDKLQLDEWIALVFELKN
ncbi:MAG: 50S ribosomal protein L11 methyltransferase [Bacteroidetes bacterium]|nr:50S ribosomal protein L11 methyltransferase [Bacteroidota bacterium]